MADEKGKDDEKQHVPVIEDKIDALINDTVEALTDAVAIHGTNALTHTALAAFDAATYEEAAAAMKVGSTDLVKLAHIVATLSTEAIINTMLLVQVEDKEKLETYVSTVRDLANESLLKAMSDLGN